MSIAKPVADASHSRLYVDDEVLPNVVAVEFSTTHLLLCLLVDADIAATIERFKQPHRFHIVIDINSSPGCTVVDQHLDGLRFDRVNYRCNTNHFVVAPVTTKPSGLWVAELRFVAKLSAIADDDQETS